MEPTSTKSERELLKAIFRLSSPGLSPKGGAAHTSDVADRLGVTPGTVTVGVKRLADRDLVVHRPYRGVELTAKGHELAVAVIRRHRIVERFLADFLQYSWKEADRLATTFEHQIPQEVEVRMYAALGYPEVCPHGFPIPHPDASEVPQSHRLSEMEVGAEAVVALSGDTQTDVAEFLETLGVRPGVVIELRDRQPFDGPLSVRVDGNDHVVGGTVANNIFVIGKAPARVPPSDSSGARVAPNERSN